MTSSSFTPATDATIRTSVSVSTSRSMISSPTLWARGTVAMGWVFLGVAAVLSAMGVQVPDKWLIAPLVASVLFLGLPHGAADHIVLLRQRGLGLTWRYALRVVRPYLAIASAYLLVWLVAPVAAFVLFILMTWLHWGQGDVHSLRALSGADHLASRTHNILALVVRGGLPMLVPLIFFPAVYVEVATWVVNALGTRGQIDWVASSAFRLSVAGAFGVVVAFYFLTTRQTEAASQASWRTDLAEVFLLFVFFATVHPLLAVGIYFCLWHSARHIVRLVGTDFGGRTFTPATLSWRGIWRFTIYALPTTIVAIVSLIGLFLLVPADSVGASLESSRTATFVGRYLLLISVLTLPHVWVVFRMDARERLWSGNR